MELFYDDLNLIICCNACLYKFSIYSLKLLSGINSTHQKLISRVDSVLSMRILFVICGAVISGLRDGVDVGRLSL